MASSPPPPSTGLLVKVSLLDSFQPPHADTGRRGHGVHRPQGRHWVRGSRVDASIGVSGVEGLVGYERKDVVEENVWNRQ